jgi:hypothetical protein
MATVEQVARASLQAILVQGSEATLEADEYQDYIFSLNNYMTQLDADGISLGYTVVDSLNDEVTIPVGALRGVIANMAIEVSAQYGGVISEALVLSAKKGMETMRKLGQRMGSVKYPSTLPRGTGNYDSFGISDNFYPESEADILAETTGAIGLEENT